MLEEAREALQGDRGAFCYAEMAYDQNFPPWLRALPGAFRLPSAHGRPRPSGVSDPRGAAEQLGRKAGLEGMDCPRGVPVPVWRGDHVWGTNTAATLPGAAAFGRREPATGRRYGLEWYSWVVSNHRPPEPQSDALTN